MRGNVAEPIGLHVYVDEGQTAKLFSVWNSSNRKLLVLAQNGATAVSRAVSCGHVKDARNAVVGLVNMESASSSEEKFFASVRAAIRDGRQGIVKNVDGFAVFESVGQNKTYAPIVEVRSQ